MYKIFKYSDALLSLSLSVYNTHYQVKQFSQKYKFA